MTETVALDMAPSTCFLSVVPISTSIRRPSTTSSLDSRPLRRPTFRCVLDEPRQVERKKSVPTKSTSSKRFYSFPTGENATPANYRLLPDDEPNKPPPPPIHYTVPVMGYFIDLIMNRPTRREKARRFGGIFTSSGISVRMHHITDYNAICEMLADWETFRAKGSSPKQIDMFGENAMNLLDGDDHAQLRSKFMPLFSAKLIAKSFQSVLRRAKEKWSELAAQSAAGKTVLLETQFRQLYLASGIELTTGLTTDDVEYPRIIDLLTQLALVFVSPRFGFVFDNAMKAKAELIQIVSKVLQRINVKYGDTIEKLRTYGEEVFSIGGKSIGNSDVSMALLLLAAETRIQPGVENELSVFSAVAQQIYGLWFASYATSAVTSSCAMFEILLDDNISKTLREEQESIISEANGARDVEYSQLGKMDKLESLLNECLRLHPVATGVVRRCDRDAEVFGRLIEKDSKVWFDFATAMLDDNYYPDAQSFKWDRFLKAEGKPPVPKVLTFGPPGAPHYCQGWQFAYMLMKTTFAIILREYTVVRDPKSSTKYAQFPENIPESKVAVSVIRPRSES